MQTLIPWMRHLYFSRAVDGMAIIATADEFAVTPENPFMHRFYSEFSVDPRPDDANAVADWEMRAARRALIEEAPDLVIFPALDSWYEELLECCKTRCIPVDIGPVPGRSGHSVEVCTRPPWRGSDEELLRPYLERLAGSLRGKRGVVWGPDWLTRALSGLGFELVQEGSPTDWLVAWLALGRAESPQAILTRAREISPGQALFLEPVNLGLPGARTFRFGDYDNEFALAQADADLARLDFRPGWAEVWGRRCGAAAGGGDHPEAPDGKTPLFCLQLTDAQAPHWLDRFTLGQSEPLRIVLADSQSIAGSAMNHAVAINRYTSDRATVLCTQRHPFIRYPERDCPLHCVERSEDLTPEVRRVLEEADCFVFFEDDDETSSDWPFPLQSFVTGKRVLHLYIGYRAHLGVAKLQRPGRSVITPLPHLLRMYPQADFYAGFPPCTLDDLPLQPPLSERDGVVRVLHTPSLPHRTLSRYYYHKDTELYLQVARELKPRYGEQIRFWQVGGWSHSQVLQMRQQCDISFNQLRGYHGLAGGEAMYLGRPMLQAFDQANINRHKEYWGLDVPFPWVTTTPQTLRDNLTQLIEDPLLRNRIGQESREFMLNYFSPRLGVLPFVWFCRQASVPLPR
jgi:hypothetical protein